MWHISSFMYTRMWMYNLCVCMSSVINSSFLITVYHHTPECEPNLNSNMHACTDLQTWCTLWRAACGRGQRAWPERRALPGTPAQTHQPLCWSRLPPLCSWCHVGGSPEHSSYWDSALPSSPTERMVEREKLSGFRVYAHPKVRACTVPFLSYFMWHA